MKEHEDSHHRKEKEESNLHIYKYEFQGILFQFIDMHIYVLSGVGLM